MREVRFFAGRSTAALVAMLAVWSVAVGCSDYGFEPRASIGVGPASIVFPGQRAKNDGVTRTIYVKNQAITASLKIYEMWFNDRDHLVPDADSGLLTPRKMHPYCAVPSACGAVAELPQYNGFYYYRTDDTTDPMGEEDVFFQLGVDFDLRYLVHNPADAGSGLDKRQASVNIINSRATQFVSAVDGVDGNSNLCGDVAQSAMQLYGLNYCDQWALRASLLNMDDEKDNSSYTLYVERKANYWSMFSTLGGYAQELGLIRCGTVGDEKIASEDDISKLNIIHPNLYNPNDFLDADGELDWDKIGDFCAPGGVLDESKLSIEVGNNALAELVKLETLPVRVRFNHEPTTLDESGNEVTYRSVMGLPPQGAGVEILEDKQFSLVVFNSAPENDNQQDVKIFVNSSIEGAPVPVIEEFPDDLEPLDKVTINGCGSYSPHERYPLSYKWEWVEKPALAQDAVLIEQRGSHDFPDQFRVDTGDFVDECKPKLYLPLSGVYTIRLKVRDAAGNESVDEDGGPSKEWEYITLLVVPKNKVFVQLAWDKGNSVDMDVFMARYRENGTMGFPFAFKDRVQAPAPQQRSCSTAADCYSGAFTCGGDGFCDLSCSTDADCHAGHPGWYCDTANGSVCRGRNNQEWWCDTDADCVYNGENYFCNPFDVNDPNSRQMCSKHTFEQTNDSCSFHNPRPDWGVRGEREDNPSLDIDDVDGYGPEVISISEPPEGKFRAVVRLYADPNNEVTEANPVNAFVSIYIKGEFCGTYTIPMSDVRPDCTSQCTVQMYWKVVDIEWFDLDASNSCANSVTVVDISPQAANDPPLLSEFCLDAENASCEYANPFNAVFSSAFDPCDEFLPRSIWCDSASHPDCTATCP